MSDFGRDNPREMPRHLFFGTVGLDYGSAVRANVDRQNCSICPRYWYVDATFTCRECGARFTFSAAEQRVWYEDCGFWIDSLPAHCLDCRRRLRTLKAIRQEYDREIAHALETRDVDTKNRLATLIDLLYEIGGELPPRITEHRRRLANAIAKADRD
jgi:hypothetical protein